MANERARALRKNQTEAERVFWRSVRSRQLDGHKFRRQQPIGEYIVDFICLEQKLIIELDGEQHACEPQKSLDKKRDAWLESLGYRVIRYWNHEIHENLHNMLSEIATYLQDRTYGPPPP